MTMITAQVDIDKLAQAAQVAAAAAAWRDVRRALMKASADGVGWTPELVERLTSAETRLEQTLKEALS